jgi:hypothetical protein
MVRELEHMLQTHCHHEAMGEQSSLRDLLASLRSLAVELQLDFEAALSASFAAPEATAS